MFFFTGVAIKIAVSMNWCTTLKDIPLDLVGAFSFEGLLYFVYNFG